MDDRNPVGEFLKEKIAGYEFRPRVASYGRVVSFCDGVTFVEGLRDVGCDEIIDFGENRYGHPAQETLDRIAASGAEVLRTDLDGDIIIMR